MPDRIEQTIKRLRSGEYLAEVTVELRFHDGKEYSPTLSLNDALKVERVRKALDRGDIPAAASEARLYRLTPVTAA